LAQDVFLQLWRSRDRYTPQGQFVSYLFTLVRNRCLSVARAQRPSAPLPEDLADGAGQLDDLLARERDRKVRERIAALTPKLREAVLLRFEAGLSYAEIGGIVACPEATARSRVFLAMNELRARLTEEES
jgi:RNA polymerase sigma-70 factor (ECF subfamily)